MKKKLITFGIGLFLTALLLPGMAYAETDAGKDGWDVYFDGNDMVSTFKSSQIDDEIFLLQPGDETEFHLTLSNRYTVETNWYMTNEVLRSLEDSQKVAEGGAYSYILTYINPEGEAKDLYNSEEIGGDTINDSGEGLHQATDSLKDWFYLDTLEAGEQGAITLKVKLEGETQGNIYQDTLAKLQMNFAVELPQSKPGTPWEEVNTGDDTSGLVRSAVMMGVGIVCLIGVVVGKHHSMKKDAADKKQSR